MTVPSLPNLAMDKVGQIARHNTNQKYGHWADALKYVRAVELDVWPLSNWTVSHDFAAGAGKLESYIGELKTWHLNHPGHDLMTVFIEVKSREGWKVPDFESILLQFDRADLFKPSDLLDWAQKTHNYQGNLTDMRSLVKAHGWPETSDTRVKNRIMFVVNGEDHVTDTYLAERGVGKPDPLCFVMSSSDDQRVGKERIVIFNGEYNNLPVISNPPDRCLRRAYMVQSGNPEMVDGQSGIATQNMRKKAINFLAYDNVKNAFSIDLSPVEDSNF